MLNQPSLSDLSETISSHGSKWTRREALKLLSVAGAGSAVFARALSALAAEKTEVTGDMIRQAEWISSLELTTEERKLMLKGVTGAIEKYQKLREVPLDNGVPPALRFDPTPLTSPHTNPGRSTVQITPSASSRRPDSSEDLAFSSLTKLSALVRSRQVTSVELTRLYLERLHRYDPALHCVITYTAELALKQAEQADREIAEGGYRGPLHGIPWGAKDILAVPGYPTTWGAMPYKEQVRPDESTVFARLREAGAVLVAKLSWALWRWEMSGSEPPPRIPGSRNKGPAAPRRVRRRRRQQAWSASPSAPKREEASSLPVPAAGPPDCAPLSGESAATAPWPSRGAWTKSVPSPGPWKIWP